MYVDDVAEEESHVAATAVVAAGTTVWLLVDGTRWRWRTTVTRRRRRRRQSVMPSCVTTPNLSQIRSARYAFHDNPRIIVVIHIT
jgi:hypothetical protein